MTSLFSALLWVMLTCGLALADTPAPAGAEAYGHDARKGGLQCDVGDPCSDVLPGAVRFERPKGKPYAVGYNSAGERVGWVVLSNDVVDVKGYSGKPLSTLVGLDAQGIITGGQVVHHSEPILLVGIPEQKLHDFVNEYVGVRADENVVVGKASEGQRAVDIVSGATVTVLAQNRTILDSARELAQDVGVIKRVAQVPGHFVQRDDIATWAELEKKKVFGRLTVSAEEMGSTGEGYQDAKGSAEPFIDLWFAIVDAPHVGKALLGEGAYAHHMSQLAENEHLLVVLGQGQSTFKGSGFVRGGIFDRIRMEQGLSALMFRDLDYTNLSGVAAEGAPEFKEGALFVARDGKLDPGASFDLVFLGSRFDGQGGFSREFHAFKGSHRMPKSVYVLDGPDPEQAIWRQAWKNNSLKAVATVLWLGTIVGLFAGRRWLTASMKRLQRVHISVMAFSFVVGGLVLGAQPSVTQLLTFVGSVVHEWRWGLFLSEPLLFISWIFIAIVTLVWGRGVFCGWACPYGSMSELIYKAARKLKIPEIELPEPIHRKARLIRYVVLVGLVATYLLDPVAGEKAAEIEPFKSTFFVAFWTRQWYFAGWWLLLAGLSVLTYRPFCQYLCPLGTGLAIPGSLRASGPYRREFCSKCKICTKGCEPRAIRADGTIDPRDCLSCMECETNWADDKVCPPLVKLRRDLEKQGQGRKIMPREVA